MTKLRKEIIKLTPNMMKKIELFVDSRFAEDQSLYKKRGGFKKDDLLVGAMAEVGVSKFLKGNGIKVRNPDFTIYDKSQKSYKADLTHGKKHFHVKGQSLSSANRYGGSWLMQKWDPLISTNQPEKRLNNYMVPCIVDIEKREITVYGAISFNILVDWGCIGECSVPMFRNNKVAIYLESLASLSTNARWGVVDRSKA